MGPWQPIRKTGRAVVLGLPLALLPHASAAAATPQGYWLTEKEKVAVELYDCPSGLCGRIVWMAKPFRKDGALRRDEKNPQADLRDRPWCGMTVISGLAPETGDLWTGGKFYYPEHGRHYDLELSEDGEKLEVHAFLGLRLLGVTETWRRIDSPPGTCPAPQTAEAEG